MSPRQAGADDVRLLVHMRMSTVFTPWGLCNFLTLTTHARNILAPFLVLCGQKINKSGPQKVVCNLKVRVGGLKSRGGLEGKALRRLKTTSQHQPRARLENDPMTASIARVGS